MRLRPEHFATARYLAVGIACSLLVWPWAHALNWWVPIVGALAGFAYGATYRPGAAGALDGMLTCAVLAIPLWCALDVVVIPVAQGHAAAWSASGMRGAFPALIGWIVSGAALSLVIYGEGVFFGRETPAAAVPTTVADPLRVVIVGGGFAGMTTAAELEKALGADGSIAITLVSQANALLFTPMLAEVAGSSIEPTHISSPLRTSLRRTDVVRARVGSIDLHARRVELAAEDGARDARYIAYDHLVLALGAVSNFFGQENISRVALDFKSLTDAIRIRNHVISVIDRADRELDDGVKRRLLTFVVAGGGFAGIELGGALNDFARGVLIDYPNLRSADVRVVIVHSRDRVLPELSATLASYALERMTERGVEFRLNARVADATPDAVMLDPPETIAANTLVWTAGTAPHPLLATLDVERNKRGAVVVDASMAVPGRANLWALGDCAAIPTGLPGGTFPPTAQHALREAATLARNILASTRNESLSPFRFRSPGSLCVIGHQIACAEIREPLTGKTLLFSGVFAWFMWRAIYLAKLPGFERKVRVIVDWITELFFPRDTVQTIELT